MSCRKVNKSREREERRDRKEGRERGKEGRKRKKDRKGSERGRRRRKRNQNVKNRMYRTCTKRSKRGFINKKLVNIYHNLIIKTSVQVTIIHLCLE